MFQTHIVDFHIGKRAILQCLLDSQTGIIGMYVHLHDILIRNTHNGITDRLKICLEIYLCLDVERFVQHNDEFRTVTELNFCFGLRTDISGYSPLYGTALCLNSKIYFFTQKYVNCS